MLHDIDFKLIETLAGRLKLGYSDGLFGFGCAAGFMRTITLCFGKANRTYAVSDGLFGFECGEFHAYDYAALIVPTRYALIVDFNRLV